MAKRQFPSPKAKGSTQLENTDENDPRVNTFLEEGATTLKTASPAAEPPPEEVVVTKLFNCHLPVTLIKKMKQEAVDHDTTMTNIVLEALTNRYLSAKSKDEP